MKRAMITGITGQDGPYLADFLLKKGYKVYGIYRRNSTPNFWRLQALGVIDKISLIPADMTDMTSLLEAVTIANPDEIYNLAAQSFVGASFDQPIVTAQVDALGPLILLEIIRSLNKPIKLYQASTSELYGDAEVVNQMQNENSEFKPTSPYAIAKLYAYHMTRVYREAYGIFACNGILFNHESPLRGLEFVTRKITNSVARIKLGLQKKLYLGNMDSKRDWGFAPDYVEAMWMLLQKKEPMDCVIATNETHSVREFVEETFKVAGIKNWEKYVESHSQLKRPHEVPYLRGDYSKAKEKLGWEPKTKFKVLVKKMYEADLSRWKKFQKGERFPWDAFNYIDDLSILKRSEKKSKD